jgi:hypothetical protein
LTGEESAETYVSPRAEAGRNEGHARRSTEKAAECLLAEVFRKADAADYGSTFLCWDVLFTRLVNPQIGLDLEGTLMQGKPCCHYRWFVKA